MTLADRICQGSWPCSTAGSLGAINGLSDVSEPLPAMSGARLKRRLSQEHVLLQAGEAERGVST